MGSPKHQNKITAATKDTSNRRFHPYQKPGGNQQGKQVRDFLLQYEATVEGFHVTSHQANFASRHTRDRHVGFHSHSAALEKQQNVPELLI